MYEKADYDYEHDQDDQHEGEIQRSQHHGREADLDQDLRLDPDVGRKAKNMKNVYNMRSNDVVVQQQPAGTEYF